jgi:transposase-like protein
MIQSIQIQTRLQTQSYNNLPDSFQKFLITATGKYMWLEPQCKHCGSENVVQNGYYRCESRVIEELGLNIRQGHYLCNDCQLTFSTPFPELQKFLQALQTFLQETCFSLFMKGMSFGGIADYISQQFNMRISDETVRRYYTKIARSFRSRKVLKSSGYFSVDCQHVKVNGEKLVRLSVMDVITGMNLIDTDIEAEKNEEVIDRLRLLLLPYKVNGMIVDGKGGLLKALRKEFKAPVQRCIMHVQKLIIMDYFKKYDKSLTLLQLRNMYMLLNVLMEQEQKNKCLKDSNEQNCFLLKSMKREGSKG